MTSSPALPWVDKLLHFTGNTSGSFYLQMCLQWRPQISGRGPPRSFRSLSGQRALRYQWLIRPCNVLLFKSHTLSTVSLKKLSPFNYSVDPAFSRLSLSAPFLKSCFPACACVRLPGSTTSFCSSIDAFLVLSKHLLSSSLSPGPKPAYTL